MNVEETKSRHATGSDVELSVEPKSPLMIGTFLALWILSLIYYGPRLWQLVRSATTGLELVLLSAYCFMLVIFWLLAAYYIAVVLFSFLSKPLPTPEVAAGGNWPDVAILYPTCNDFQAEAAASCLDQTYPSFHLFLLDDSTEDEFLAAVNAFHGSHLDRTTIVRRQTRKGFKAGNLNHALSGPAAAYPFFAVVDADERLPSDFLQRTMAHMRDSDLAFVQANHAPNPGQDARFAREMGASILPFWDVHCRPRNRYGLVLYLGHGAIVRRSAWETIGGFPEVVLEDLAFSAVTATRGMRGIFLENLLCFEDFPGTYQAFKRQHERYVIGTTQVMRKYLRPLLQSPRLGLVEKADFCLWCSPLYVPALCLAFLVICSLGIAGMLGDWQVPEVSVLGHQLTLPTIRAFDERFVPLWSWDFQLFSVICALSPVFACLALGVRGKLHTIRLLFLSTVPYLSLMVVSWRGILGYLLLGRTFSPPTGERVLFAKDGSISLTDAAHRRFSEHEVVWHAPKGWEVLIGGLLTIASLASLNLALSAVSCCLTLGVLIEISGWEQRSLRIACVSCFALILVQMVINIAFLGQSPGMAPLVFSVHF